MHPLLFKLGSLTIYSYGFMVALAFVVGILLTVRFAKKEGIAPDNILDLSLYVILSSVIGARLFYVIGQWDYYQTNLLEIFYLQNGGLVFLGGMLLAMLTILIYAKIKNISFFKLADAIAPGAALGYSIGRIGCLLNGCCFGIPTNAPWGIVFPAGSLASSYYNGTHLHPTQIYSSLAMLLAFIALILIYRNKKYDGQVIFWGIAFYSFYRFLVELYRYSPIHWLGLTPSQWIAFVLLLLCFILRKKRG